MIGGQVTFSHLEGKLRRGQGALNRVWKGQARRPVDLFDLFDLPDPNPQVPGALRF